MVDFGFWNPEYLFYFMIIRDKHIPHGFSCQKMFLTPQGVPPNQDFDSNIPYSPSLHYGRVLNKHSEVC